jgi:hypothetical protein
MKYQTKPVEVEAIQLIGADRKSPSPGFDNQRVVNWKEVEEFCEGSAIGNSNDDILGVYAVFGTLETGSYKKMAQPWEWVVKNLDGSFDLFTSTMFEKRFESVHPPAADREAIREALKQAYEFAYLYSSADALATCTRITAALALLEG